ncbi:hypothetical protein [Rufibacter quisquiliarum]|uniref:Uncharacterized protein n=1 Tax=Rufibacter quisquiliarum TaxID=1549639 RepID=A0A839GTK1_9BACT|nr:hypothetical protein [Rufibacter quisquiliarum]MBA9077111.1 hypothetical protein [Rufibacter quisquiliarum]
MHSDLLRDADSLDLSLAEYVAMTLSLGQYGNTDLQPVKEKLQEVLMYNNELQQKLEDSPWVREPMASSLQALLRNDEIMRDLYGRHGAEPVPRQLMAQEGFRFNVMSQGVTEGEKNFYFSGSYGWAYADKNKKYVQLTRRG